jgi:dihydrofolate synthase/folylpolyglutamate synthase
MNYDEAVAWIDSFHQFGIKLGLKQIEQVLQQLDNPHQKIKAIHVAGTNGKGSVCRFMSSILRCEGYKTGLYLSPHLIDFRERFQLNDKYISKNRFVEIVKQVKPVVNKYISNDGQLTYFEVCTIIAFVFFSEEQVDYAVIEVGLGGRYDATNVVEPLLSVITNVSLDHQKHLGDSIKEIAIEKAGIIKSEIPVVTGAEGIALSAIKKTCELHKVPLRIVTSDMIETVPSVTDQHILFHGFFHDYEVRTYQLGIYQAINVAVSIASIEILQQRGVYITKESIINGIEQMNHPGRMQVLSHHPYIIVDGAHNPDAMKLAVKSITTLFPSKKIIVIFGVMKDKDIKNILNEIIPIASKIIVTEPELERSEKSGKIAEFILELNQSIDLIQTTSVNGALKKAIEMAHNDDVIFGTGSLFTVGEIIQILKE